MEQMHAKRIILLVGPKGSGKSHIGVELARQFEARFLRIEAIWQALHLERGDFLSEAYIDAGMARSLAFVEDAVGEAEAAVISRAPAASPGSPNSTARSAAGATWCW